jgi:hypothetical protein
MTTIDKYLSFENEAAAKAVLYRIEGAVEANPDLNIEAQEGYEVPNYRNIDTIGVIYKPTGEVTTDDNEESGIEIPVMEPIAGWHVNIRVMDDEDVAALEPFEVYPVTPMRVWAS